MTGATAPEGPDSPERSAVLLEWGCGVRGPAQPPLGTVVMLARCPVIFSQYPTQ